MSEPAKTEQKQDHDHKPNRVHIETSAAQMASLDEASKAAKDTPSSRGYALYVTSKKENSAFSIRAGNKLIRGHRDTSKNYILFRVPHDVVKNFERHDFVRTGRIIKAKAQ